MKRIGHRFVLESLLASVLILLVAEVTGVSFAEEIKLRGAIPFAIFNRVLRIRIGKGVGSCFVIDVDRRQYIVTARHLAKGMGERSHIQLYLDEKWLSLAVRPIWPEKERTDIVAFASDRVIAPKMEIAVGAGDMYVGQEVYFLGFPFGLGTHFDQSKPALLPFVKQAILSAIDGSDHIFYLDGINNPGFSGGPVIFANHNHNDRLQIGAVISSYRNNPIEVRSAEIPDPHSKSEVKTNKRVVHYVLENTGIVVAYNILEIEKAIRANPIGPPIPEQE